MIIARSFARAFYRNAVTMGIWLITLGETKFHCEDGNQLEVDPRSGGVTNRTTGEQVRGIPLSGMAREIVEAGGATRYFKPKVLYPEKEKNESVKSLS